MKVFALHGFLGLPTDFNSCFQELEKVTRNMSPFFKDPLQAVAVDYINEPQLRPQYDLKQWGRHFNQYVSNFNFKNKKLFLMGYSQGARLAMQAYAQFPEMWEGLILISGHPGLEDLENAQARIINDDIWAEKFLRGDFQGSVREWNQQAVFSGSKNEPLRLENDYTRELLYLALKNWSVAQQESFLPKLLDPHHSQKIQIIFGSRDLKYKELYQNIHKKNPRLSIAEIEDSGHRVLFDQPAILAEKIAGFISRF